MDNGQPGPVEVLRDVVDAIDAVWVYLVVFGVGVALVVMGNTLARLIGVGLLVMWLYFGTRLARRRFANRLVK